MFMNKRVNTGVLHIFFLNYTRTVLHT